MAAMEKTKKMSQITRNYKKCVICNIRRTPGSNVHLARIPLDPERCRLWIHAIGQEELVELPIEKLHELKFVCNNHFPAGEFNETTKRLVKHAIPTLNLPLQPLKDELFTNFPLHIGQYPSHGILGDKQKIYEKDNQVSQVNEGENVLLKEACSTSQYGKPGTPESPIASTSCKVDIITQNLDRESAEVKDILQDITNMASGSSPARTAEKRKSEPISTSFLEAPVAGPSREKEIVVQSYKRKRKSAEAKDVHTQNTQEKLLQKLKSQKVTIRRLAKSSLNLDEVDNVILKNLLDDVRKNRKRKQLGSVGP